MSSTPSLWVEFPAFRQYEATRQEANNAMMALLAGAQLAAHTLQLTEGSTSLLPDIFPGVEHIRYFNLRTDAAAAVLKDTGHHLGAVAVPYALAVHEDFLMTVLDLVQSFGFVLRAPGDNADTSRNKVMAWNMHEALWLTLGHLPPPRGSIIALEHFHLLREMRNAQIHAGGTVSTRLHEQVQLMTAPAKSAWESLSRRAPADVITGGSFRLTTFDIFAAFATAKTLGRAINQLLKDNVRPRDWASICVEDYSALASKPPRSDAWMRGLVGHATLFYSAAGISEQELAASATAAGLWPSGRQWLSRRATRSARRRRNPGSRG